MNRFLWSQSNATGDEAGVGLARPSIRETTGVGCRR
jgi:hypothetical protein